ncbi:unnamed protein product [Hymenolepis diminuta]|uniref:Secreted protein n=1 Tax=Hymenolepis diminuta TaxID=6216 RepID=A0A0R3SPF1_HYMDI|nr:unnamed protein product [Hymenolepis diminuta]
MIQFIFLLAVRRYITCPCKTELVDAIDMKPERALAFLLAYFKNRGPFLTWIHRGREFANATGRCLSTAFISRLNTLPEIEMCAAIAIGRYLNNLHRIAADHKIVNFRTNLATVWGPLYINVEPATDIKPPIIMTECEKFSASVEIFAKVLDTVPWESAASLRNVSLPTRSMPYMDSVYSTTNRIREACLMKLINKPSSCKGSLAEILHNEAMIACTKSENQKPEEQKIKMAKCCTELVPTDKFKLPCEKSC